MAEELGVSRGPVREALRQIEQEGLVEYTSHVGCSVKDFTAQDVYEVYLLRANLEILSVKMCEGHFSQQTLKRMEEILNRMDSIVFYRGAGKSEYVIHNQRKIHQKVFDALKTGDVNRICSTLMEHYMETINGYLIEHKISAQDFPYKINMEF